MTRHQVIDIIQRQRYDEGLYATYDDMPKADQQDMNRLNVAYDAIQTWLDQMMGEYPYSSPMQLLYSGVTHWEYMARVSTLEANKKIYACIADLAETLMLSGVVCDLTSENDERLLMFARAMDMSYQRIVSDTSYAGELRRKGVDPTGWPVDFDEYRRRAGSKII